MGKYSCLSLQTNVLTNYLLIKLSKHYLLTNYDKNFFKLHV